MNGKIVFTAEDRCSEELDDDALARVNGGLMKSDPTMPVSGTGGGGSTGGVATAGAAVASAVQTAFQPIGNAIASVFHKP